MKTIFFTLASFLFASLAVLAQNPVPNASFENWTDGNPDQWYTINIPGLFVPVTPASPGHSGEQALKAEVVTVAGGVVVPILQSHVDENLNGFPLDEAFPNLRFRYKFHPEDKDRFKVSVVMFDSNFLPIGSSEEVYFTSPAEEFTEANISIEYYGDPATIGRCLITMVVTAGDIPDQETAGTYFIVDDVELNDGGSTPAQEETPGFSLGGLYPNPCHSQLKLQLSVEANERVSVSIFDLQGRELLKILDEEMHNGEYALQADMSEMPAGTYLCRVNSPSGTSARLLHVY